MSFGDVVLVPFPFTDQSGTKKRPAVRQVLQMIDAFIERGQLRRKAAEPRSMGGR